MKLKENKDKGKYHNLLSQKSKIKPLRKQTESTKNALRSQKHTAKAGEPTALGDRNFCARNLVYMALTEDTYTDKEACFC